MVKLLTLLGSLLIASGAHAQSCAADDYSKHRALPDPNDLAALVAVETSDWHEVSALLGRLQQRVLAEDSAAPFPPYRALAAMLDLILKEYDGSASLAFKARLNNLQPVTCPVDAEGFPTCAWEVLAAQVKVPEGDKDGWTCSTKTRFARYLVHAQDILNRQIQPLVNKTAKQLTAFARQWQRYVENGYSQYPWEVVLNGALFLDEERWTPPRNQLIALHPAVGLGTANLREEGNGTRAAAFVLAIEAVGWVGYTPGFAHHLGASLAASLPNFEWDGVGIGPVLHFDGFGIGYNFGLEDRQPDTLFLLLDVTRSIDDSKWLAKANQALRDKLD